MIRTFKVKMKINVQVQVKRGDIVQTYSYKTERLDDFITEKHAENLDCDEISFVYFCCGYKKKVFTNA